MDILVSAIVLVLAIAVAGTLCYILKNIIVLLINAVAGVVDLFVLNLFHVMSLAGAPDLPIDGITVMVFAIGGLPGVILRVILHLSGVVVLVVSSLFLPGYSG